MQAFAVMRTPVRTFGLKDVLSDITLREADALFFKKRDESLTSQGQPSRDMSWRYSNLKQNFLFFIVARTRRGSEPLARQCIRMGVDLTCVHSNKQTCCSAGQRHNGEIPSEPLSTSRKDETRRSFLCNSKQTF